MEGLHSQKQGKKKEIENSCSLYLFLICSYALLLLALGFIMRKFGQSNSLSLFQSYMHGSKERKWFGSEFDPFSFIIF
jgi:hypothetical protein